MDLSQAVVHLVLAALQQLGEGLPAKTLDKLVRVLGALHPQYLYFQAGLFQQGDSPLGGRHSGPIAVIGDDGLLKIPGQQLGVLTGERGAQRGHSTVKACLVKGDSVHIPFGENDPPGLGGLGNIQGKDVPAFVVYRCVRGVEVFGGGIVHYPAAKANDVSTDVNDGEHDPIAESVIDAAVLVVDGQTGVQQIPLVIALIGQGLDQGVPAVGSEAQPEVGQGGAGQPTLLQIGQSLRPLGSVQPLVEGPGGLLVEFQQFFPPLPHPGGGAAVWHLHSDPLGQHLHRFSKGEVVQLHHKIDGAASLAASKALEDALVSGYGEGGSLFTVEGAQAPVVPALLCQPDGLGHQIYNIGAVQKLVQEWFWNGQCAPPLSKNRGNPSIFNPFLSELSLWRPRQRASPREQSSLLE